MNLPEFGSSIKKSSKVLALGAIVFACAACGGGNTPAEGENAPVSDEIVLEDKGGDQKAAETPSDAAETAPGTEVAAEDGAAAGDTAAAPAEASKAPVPQPKVKRSQFRRDPFVNLVQVPDVRSMAPGRTASRPASPKASAVQAATAKGASVGAPAVETRAPEKPKIKVSKPNVKVSGILRSGAGYTAMLTDGAKGRTLMVKTGDVVGGGYVVTNVTPTTVTVVFKGKYKFILPMEREVFGHEAKASANK